MGEGIGSEGLLLHRSEQFDSGARSTPTGQSQLWKLHCQSECLGRDGRGPKLGIPDHQFQSSDELRLRRHTCSPYRQCAGVQWFVANHKECRLQRPNTSLDWKCGKFASICQLSKEPCRFQVGVCVLRVLAPSEFGKTKGIAVNVLPKFRRHAQAQLLENLYKMILSPMEPVP